MAHIAWREKLAVFLIFVSLGVIWSAIMPLWQGPDEPAHFAYVQSMEHRVFPPRQRVVPAGQSPWLFNPSPAENLSIRLAGRFRVLQSPSVWLSLTAIQRRAAMHALARASQTPQRAFMGTQNYVEIYPPLYYDSIAWMLAGAHIRNILTAVYCARFASALWLGLAGVLWDLALASVVRPLSGRLGFLMALVLLIPTFGMLGGSVGNDIAADTASLAIFGAALWAVRHPPRLTSRTCAAGFGLLAGLAVWTKEEAYIALALSAPFVAATGWRRATGWRQLWTWLAISSGMAAIVAAPWCALMLHRYQSLIPPMTYQGAGDHPRTLGFVLYHEFLNRTFESNLLVTQALFGMDCPWWKPWGSEPWIHHILAAAEVSGLAGGLAAARHDRGWALSAVWIAAGSLILWAMQGEYNILTGMDFLQGRYFLFLAGPVSWLMAHVWVKLPKIFQALGLAGASTLFLATASHTLWRFYHQTLWDFLLGRTVILAPLAATLAARLCVVLLVSVLCWLLIHLLIPPPSQHSDDPPVHRMAPHP